MLQTRVAGAIALVVSCTVAAAAQTADEIIARNIEAKGGLERLRAVESLRITGTMTVKPGMEAPFVMEFKRPNRMRMNIDVEGRTVTQGFDGKTGWILTPRGPEKVPVEAARMMEEQADFDGPLVDYRAKGHRIELAGKETVEGREAYKLEITFKNGDVRYYFLDAETYLEVRVEGKTSPLPGKETETEGRIGDYREVDGLMIPHLMESGPKGSSERGRMVIQKVEINPEIPDTRFRMPRF